MHNQAVVNFTLSVLLFESKQQYEKLKLMIWQN